VLNVGDRLEHPMEQTFYTIVDINDDGYVLHCERSYSSRMTFTISWELYDRLNWIVHTHIGDLVEIVCE
jgi:hypothetical protein